MFKQNKAEYNEMITEVRSYLGKKLTKEDYDIVDQKLKIFEKHIHERTENYQKGFDDVLIYSSKLGEAFTRVEGICHHKDQYKFKDN